MTTNQNNPLHNAEYERNVLGTMMLDKAQFPEVVNVIPEIMSIIENPTTFVTQVHQIIYEAIVECHEAHGNTQPVMVATHIRNKGGEELLNRADGPISLYDLQESIVETETALIQAHELQDLATRRQSFAKIGNLVSEFQNLDKPALDTFVDIQEHILDASTGSRDDKRKTEGMSTLVRSTLDFIEKKSKNEIPPGLPTGFHEIDRELQGLEPGHLMLVAARPGIGKSALVANIAQNLAFHYTPFDNARPCGVLIFSLEMSKREIMQRILASESGIAHSRIKQGRLADEQWDTLAHAISSLLKHDNLRINDDRSVYLDIDKLCVEARRVKHELETKASQSQTPNTAPELRVVIVDYIQLMQSTKFSRSPTREQEIAAISRRLKVLAGDLDVTVIACSQLNRESEKRPSKQPQLSDLRDSGALEQDADIVAIMHREALNNDELRTNSEPQLTSILIPKNRHGSQATVQLMFYPEIITFRDTDPQHQRKASTNDDTRRDFDPAIIFAQ